jgi:transcriptional regulator with PAS, ATPase and Fis domain
VDDLLEAELFGHARGAFTGANSERAGLFEDANGGTLFLDEAAELGPRVQAKLLRVLQEGEVRRLGESTVRRIDVRVVAATNRPLATEVEAGRFRKDLWYRLDVIRVSLPPLRSRLEDLPQLTAHIWRSLTGRTGSKALLSPATIAALSLYDWPGNVRELERLIEGVVALAETDSVELDDLPPVVRGGYSEALAPSLQRNESMRAWGSRYARLVLDRCNGNKRGAARALGISYHTLVAYLKYPAHEPVNEDSAVEPEDAAAGGECASEQPIGQ